MRNCNISQLTRELYGKHIVLYHTIHRTLLATQMSSCVIFIPDNFIIENPVIISGFYRIIYSMHRYPGHQLYCYTRRVLNIIQNVYSLLQTCIMMP